MSVELGLFAKLGSGVMRIVSIFQSENRADQRLDRADIREQCLIIQDNATKFASLRFHHHFDALGNDLEMVRLSGHADRIEEARKALRGKANPDVIDKAYTLYESCLNVLVEHGKPNSVSPGELPWEVLRGIHDLEVAWHKQLRIRMAKRR